MEYNNFSSIQVNFPIKIYILPLHVVDVYLLDSCTGVNDFCGQNGNAVLAVKSVILLRRGCFR